MITKAELMKWMKTYKAEHCKSISTMNKDQLYTEAKKHGFLHEKHGLKKKTKAPMASAPASAPKAPASKASTPGMSRKEIFQKIRELDGKEGSMTAAEVKAVAAKRTKLFKMLEDMRKA